MLTDIQVFALIGIATTREALNPAVPTAIDDASHCITLVDLSVPTILPGLQPAGRQD